MLYGYKIVDGRAVVDKPAQKKIQLLFRNYLAGMSLSKAAEKANSTENDAHGIHACENRRILRRACAAGRVSVQPDSGKS